MNLSDVENQIDQFLKPGRGAERGQKVKVIGHGRGRQLSQAELAQHQQSERKPLTLEHRASDEL